MTKLETPEDLLNELISIEEDMLKSTDKFIKAVNHSIESGTCSIEDEIPDYIFQDS